MKKNDNKSKAHAVISFPYALLDRKLFFISMNYSYMVIELSFCNQNIVLLEEATYGFRGDKTYFFSHETIKLKFLWFFACSMIITYFFGCSHFLLWNFVAFLRTLLLYFQILITNWRINLNINRMFTKCDVHK